MNKEDAPPNLNARGIRLWEIITTADNMGAALTDTELAQVQKDALYLFTPVAARTIVVLIKQLCTYRDKLHPEPSAESLAEMPEINDERFTRRPGQGHLADKNSISSNRESQILLVMHSDDEGDLEIRCYLDPTTKSLTLVGWCENDPGDWENDGEFAIPGGAVIKLFNLIKANL